MFGYATPSYKDYAEVIIAKLHTNRWFCENRPCLVIEPGMSVAASSMAYITKVFDVKKRVTVGLHRLTVICFISVHPCIQ